MTFRKAQGDEDISGDHNEYETVQEIEIQAVSVTMKGSEGKCSLALWQKDGFSTRSRLNLRLQNRIV